MATEQDIARIVTLLSAAYPNWKVNEYTIEVYFQDLRDIPTDELVIAAQHCRAETGRQFAPSTGEIRGAVLDLRKMSSNVPSAFEAWREVLVQFSDTGSYGDPNFSHPLIAEAVKRLGWKQLCLSEDQIADRARFIQCYDRLIERASKEEIMLPEVRRYIETNGARLLAPVEQIKQLSASKSVTNSDDFETRRRKALGVHS